MGGFSFAGKLGVLVLNALQNLLCELPVNLMSWERFASKRDLLILSSDVHNRNEVQRGVNIKSL